jgi:hypothetical protein
MTDPEISKALALAIGYKVDRVLPRPDYNADIKNCWVYTGSAWRIFDYRDWSVIGPIAEKFECFPDRYTDDNDEMWWDINHIRKQLYARADTPQKAIALAVIQGAKK